MTHTCFCARKGLHVRIIQETTTIVCVLVCSFQFLFSLKTKLQVNGAHALLSAQLYGFQVKPAGEGGNESRRSQLGSRTLLLPVSRLPSDFQNVSAYFRHTDSLTWTW